MYVAFDTLADTSKVWVYTADRKLTDAEQHFISAALRDFANQWAAHGQPLAASFEIRNDQFIVLAVDEDVHDASGCSIDASVRVVKEIQSRVDVDFFNRTLIPFYISESVVLTARKDLKENLQAGIWNHATPTFNVLAPSLGDIRSSWLVAADASWLKMYLKSSVIL